MGDRSQPAEPTTEALDALFDELKTWGRWGEGDQRGALNHQTKEHRRSAARLVESGRSISLAHDLPLAPTAEAPYPAQHHMLTSGDALDAQGIPGYESCGDFIGTQVHGFGVTHIDALSHMFVHGQMYGGRPPSDVRSDGARSNTVMTLAEGLVGRGVLLDIPLVNEVPHVEPDIAITVADLEAAEERAGVHVGTGDFLLVCTGRDARRRALGRPLDPIGGGLAGLHPECLRWLAEREISVLGSDGISDRMPPRAISQWPFPIHQVGIVAMGLHLVDNLDLSRLSEACAQEGRWAFQLCIGALRIPGGTGCPVNPIAVL